MARVGVKRLPSGPTSVSRPPSAAPETEPLAWRVSAKGNAQSFGVDLTVFAKGDAGADLPAYPLLIGQIAVEIRPWSFLRTAGSNGVVITALRTFWRFLSSLSLIARPMPDDVLAITPEIGVMFKLWMIQERRLSAAFAGSCLRSIRRFVEMARRRLGANPHRLIWPTVPAQRGTLHKSVAPSDIRLIYNAAKKVARRFVAARTEGNVLLLQGTDPRALGSGNDKDAWNNPANLAWLTRQHLATCLAAPDTPINAYLPKRLQRSVIGPIAAPTYPVGYRTGTPIERFRWFVPRRDDVMACLTLVLLHTGWNLDTALNIDVSSPERWYENRLGTATGETVAIFGRKEKTGREQIAFSLMRPQFHPYRIIEQLISWTEPLRASLRDRLVKLQSVPVTAKSNDQIINLKRCVASPWLYFQTAVDKITGRVGCFSTMRACHLSLPFRAFLDAAAIELPLTLSDFRDGFAAFLYDNSLYNILLVKQALGHKHLSATKHYLRQRRQLAQRFADYTDWSNVLFDEIRLFQAVDPTILYVRCRFQSVTEEQRRRLSDHRQRTRMQMGCLDPEHPPIEVAPAHAGGICMSQRCTLCSHGVVFEESFIPIAHRMAELRVIRGHTPLDRWGGSSFQAEWLAIEATIDRVFKTRAAEFECLVTAHMERLRAGKAYLFDQLPAASLRIGDDT